MRTMPLLACLLAACTFHGDATRHERCETDFHCGRGQFCEAGYCDGPGGVTFAASFGDDESDGDESNGDESNGGDATVECGDGKVEGTEECDDGDSDDTDACSNECVAQQGVRTVATGGDFTCALRSTGQVKCWGSNTHGALGTGEDENVGDDEEPAAAPTVGLPAPAIHIAAGDDHACAALETGEVTCWGAGLDGRLGYGDTANIGDDETPDSRGTLMLSAGADRVTAGKFHSCARMTDGEAICWGLGADGRLGNGSGDTIGDTEPATSGQPVAIAASIAQISAGGRHSCAQTDQGALYCFGFALLGQLGYGEDMDIGVGTLPGDRRPGPDLRGREACERGRGAHLCRTRQRRRQVLGRRDPGQARARLDSAGRGAVHTLLTSPSSRSVRRQCPSRRPMATPAP